VATIVPEPGNLVCSIFKDYIYALIYPILWNQLAFVRLALLSTLQKGKLYSNLLARLTAHRPNHISSFQLHNNDR